MGRRRVAGVVFLISLSLVLLSSGPLWARKKSISRKDWSVFRSTHFVFYYRPGIPKRFLYKMKRYAERYYRKIVTDLGLLRTRYWVWEDRCKIFIFADRDDYRKHLTFLTEWSSGGADMLNRRIYCFYTEDNQELFDVVLPHEMTHLLFYEARNGMQVPHAIDEGVAMREERDARRVLASQIRVAKSIAEGKYIPLAELLDWRTKYMKMDQETAELFYAESCLFVDFLLTEFPKSFFSTFCWRMRIGNDFYKAFRLSYARYSAYGKINIKKLEQDFWRYLKRTNPFLAYYRQKSE